MSIQSLLNSTYLSSVCMSPDDGGGAAGGGTGDAGTGDAGTGDAGTGTATDDGQGGKASMMSADTGGEGDGDDGSATGEDGKLDMAKLLGDDYAKNPNISKFMETENPVQEMAKSLLEAQSQVGKKMGIPTAETPAEEAAAFYKELGVPDDAAGYGFEKPEGVDDANYSQEHADQWAKVMRENNITKEGANNLRDAMFAEQAATAEAANGVLNEVMEKEFAGDSGKVAQQISAVMKEFVPNEDVRKAIEATMGDGNTPAFAVALGSIIKGMNAKYGRSDTNTGGDQGEHSGKSLDDLRGEAKKLMGSPAYLDPMNAGHAAAKAEVNGLYKTIGTLTDEAAKQR